MEYLDINMDKLKETFDTATFEFLEATTSSNGFSLGFILIPIIAPYIVGGQQCIESRNCSMEFVLCCQDSSW